jgi:hypothetical protein
MFIAGVNNTGDKLFIGVNDTGEKIIAGVVERLLEVTVKCR